MSGAQSTTSQALDFILAFIIIAALAIGLLSILSRKIEVWWAALQLWRDDVQAEIMSRRMMRERENFSHTSMVLPDIDAKLQPTADRYDTSIKSATEVAISPQGTITISANPSRRDRIVLLSTWKNDDGSYSLSANTIAGIVKGDRNEVLALIREVRESAPPSKPAPVFRPLTADSKPVLKETEF